MSINIGALDFEVLVKDDKAKPVLEEVKRRIQDFAYSMEQGGAGMDRAFEKASKSIQQGFETVGSAIEMNQSAVARLEEEYRELGRAAGEALMQGKDKKYVSLVQQQDEKKSLIGAHNATLRELYRADEALVQYSKHLEEQKVKTDKSAQAQESFRIRLRNLREEMVSMETAGLRGTEAYRQLQKQAGALTGAVGDAIKQTQVLAHDQSGFQGIVAGLSGVAGAASAAQGAMALFAGENENLQKLIAKIQGLMAVTVGLQQISQSLNKDSAFQLVTVQGIKDWWAKIKEEALGYQSAVEEVSGTAESLSESVSGVAESVTGVAESVSEAAGSITDAAGAVSEAANTVATGANTAAKGENAAAEGADAAATQVNTQATNQNTAAQGANTAATAGQTAAATAGTAASLTFAGALRAVGLAIKNIPVIGWIAAAIAVVISVVSHFADKAREAREETEKFYKAVAEEASKPVAQIQKLAYQWNALGNDMEAKTKFVRENRKAFEELGIAINGVADAEALLSDKTRVQAFVDAQIARAKAAVLIKNSEDKIKALLTAEQELAAARLTPTVERKVGQGNRTFTYENPEIARLEAERAEAQAEIDKTYTEIARYESEAVQKLEASGAKAIQEYAEGTVGALKQALEEKRKNLDKLRVDNPSSLKSELAEIAEMQKRLDDLLGTNGGKESENRRREAEEKKKQQKKIQEELLEMMRKNSSDRVALLEEGEQKELALLEERYDREIDLLDEQIARWKEAQGGELTVEQTSAYDTAYQQAFDKRMKAEAEFYRTRNAAAREKWNEYLKEYGSYQEKILAIENLYAAKIAEAKTDGEKKTLEAERDVEISGLKAEMMNKTALWKKFFGDLEKTGKQAVAKTVQQLELLIRYGSGEIKALPEELQAVFASLNDGSEESAKTLEMLSQRLKEVKDWSKKLETASPFKKIAQGFKDFSRAEKESEAQFNALHAILSGFSEIGGIFSELGNAMEDAGIKAGKVVTTIGDVISKAVSMAGAGASVGGGWGAIIGAVVGAASALIPALQSTQGLSEETRHYYDSLIEVTDELIEKQLQLVDASTGAAAVLASENAKLLNEYKKTTLSDELAEHLKKWGGGHHSPGVEYTDKLIDYLKAHTEITDQQAYDAALKAATKVMGDGKSRKVVFDEWHFLADRIEAGNLEITSKFIDVDELKKNGIELDDVLRDVNGSLMSFTGKQLEAFKTFAPELWALLDEETQNYLNGLIATDKYLEEIERRQKESATGATLDEIGSTLDKLYSESDLTFDKIGSSFEEHMKKAILNVVSKNSLGKVQEWYDQFSEDMEDGILDPEEAARLRQQYADMARDGNKQYEEMMKVLGTSPADSTLSPLSGAIRGASQEEINALTGYMNHTMITERDQTELIRDQLMVLTGIDAKIGLSNRYLESIDGKLTASPNPLRAQGIPA
ncbi:MAG: hypothetical protein LBP50_09545 [Tannerella sp.]|jgi:gas vesicle protein/uncharacterized membrane protein|nr:hypothetical protein [Tannerella sp.]